MSSEAASDKRHSPWAWIPTLYFAEGVPYIIVTVVSVLIVRSLGMETNAEIAFWTSLLSIPWVLKPFWAPFIDMIGTKRRWFVFTEFAMAAGFAAAALPVPVQHATQLLIGVFFCLAFLSATHDAAADGFYMIALDSHKQALFSGIRSFAYRVASVAAQGGLVMLAGWLSASVPGGASRAWGICLLLTASVFLSLGVYHLLVVPRPQADSPCKVKTSKVASALWSAFIGFSSKRGLLSALAFILLYRFAESQLVKIAPLFMLDPVEKGGLGMSLEQQGLLYGTVGVVALMLGGVLGGLAAARHGLAFWLWPMALAINIPDAVYVFLSWVQPDSLLAIGSCIAIEQFGYGFGFTAYMLYMVYYAEDSGGFKTSHYAIMTGLMAFGMLFPGLYSGEIQEWLGYKHFFLWVMLCTIPSFAVTALVAVRPDFGKAAPSVRS